MGYDVLTHRCGCGRILKRLEQCAPCTDKRRAEAVAKAGRGPGNFIQHEVHGVNPKTSAWAATSRKTLVDDSDGQSFTYDRKPDPDAQRKLEKMVADLQPAYRVLLNEMPPPFERDYLTDLPLPVANADTFKMLRMKLPEAKPAPHLLKQVYSDGVDVALPPKTGKLEGWAASGKLAAAKQSLNETIEARRQELKRASLERWAESMGIPMR